MRNKLEVVGLSNGDPNLDRLGGKALSLHCLAGAGLAIPPWVTLTTSVFEDFLLNPPDGSDSIQVKMLQGADNLPEVLSAVYQQILQWPCGEAWITTLVQRCQTEGIRFPVAVRSSAIIEDGNKESAAGAFDTVLNVTPAGLWPAVKRCWASMFGQRAAALISRRSSGTAALGMGVIIQEMVQADYSGVLFTADPISGDHQQWVCEVHPGPGTADSVIEKVYRFATGRGSFFTDSQVPPGLRLSGLVQPALQIERLIGSPVNIEWALRNDLLYILQARPITVLPDCDKDARPEIFEAEAPPLRPDFDFGELTELYERNARKHNVVRRFCRQAGIDIPKWYWMGYSSQSLNAVGPQWLESYFCTDLVYVDASKSFRGLVVRRKLLHDRLLDLSFQNGDAYTVVRLREGPNTKLSAISSVINGDQVMIEYVRGRMMPLLHGAYDVEPARYLLDEEGQVLYRHRPIQRQYLELNMETRKFEQHPLEEPAPELDATRRSRLACWTLKLRDFFGEVRPEWILTEDRVLLWDLSLEKLPLGIDIVGQAMSPGTAVGVAVKVEEDTDLVHSSNGLAFSIGDNPALLSEGHSISALRKRLAVVSSKAIIIARRPYLALAAIVDDVAGFVFESGTLLGHLAIVLRERGKPAAIVPGILAQIKDGDTVAINQGTVITERGLPDKEDVPLHVPQPQQMNH